VLGALLTIRPIARNVGVKMLGAVGVFGLGTVAFGLSTNYWLSLALLAVMGAAEMVSVFIRGTLVQLNTPDEMRGRVGAISGLAISASNELGEMESGLAAALLGATGAVVFGGIGAIAITVIWAVAFPADPPHAQLFPPNAAQRCMTMTILIPHTYHDGETVLTGHLGRPAGTPRGLIIVYPNIANMTPSVRARAEQLTAEGFLVLVADFYGQPVADFASSHPMGAPFARM
jgi:MFS family permease